MNSVPIVYLENNKSWLFDGHTFTPCDLSEVKKYQAGTTLPLSSLQVANYKFPSSLSENELQIRTELKFYEEGGLSVEKEYEISSVKQQLEFESSLLVEAFAISNELLDASFADVVKKSKAIDFIVPDFICYESFYTSSGIEAKVDLFFYLSEDEAHATLLQNGTYIAHRRLPSIDVIAQKMNIDVLKCKELLSQYGLKSSNYPEAEHPFFEQLLALFSKEVEKIVHTVNHKRGAYGIIGVDKVYVDFEGNSLDGLDSLFLEHGVQNISVEALRCKHKSNEESNRFIKAMYLYLIVNKQMQPSLNLTAYERKLAWYKRHSGVLMAVSASSLLLALVQPTYSYLYDGQLSKEVSVLETKWQQSQSASAVLQKKLKAVLSERKESEANLAELKGESATYSLTLKQLPLMLDEHISRQKMMNDAVGILQHQQLSILSLEQNGTEEMKVHVIADYAKRDHIARFMKEWMQRGYTKALTDEIYLDKNIYESTIRAFR
ncbi:MAG: hypothetical protein MUP09_10880 [Thiovulaceae bacterium]|nr:hypothetical protein [Sulfurimonadaceae bacterium]